jgi:heme/copper-type cytochrome/quinol oxidase subunit 3
VTPPLRDLRAERAADAGMWLFLASFAMLYAGLFSGYVLLRAGSETWITPWREASLWWSMPLSHLAWLAASAGAAWRWQVGYPSGSGRQHAIFWWLPIVAVVAAATNWLRVAAALARAGHAPATSVAAASWYVLTGFVALGMIGGAAAVGWLAWRHRAGAPPAHVARQVQRYWTMLAVCWLTIVVGMYLW